MSLLWADNFSAYGVGGDSGIYIVGGEGWQYILDGNYADFNFSGVLNRCVGAALVTDPDPTAGGKSVVKFRPLAGAPYDSYASQLRKVLPTSKTTIGGFCRLYWSALSSTLADGPLIRFADNSNVSNIFLQVTPLGAIRVYRGVFNNGYPTQIGETGVCITAGTWHHLEWKITFDNSAGSVELFVDGRSKLTLTGTDTVHSAANCQNVSLGTANFATGGGGNVYYKDFVLWDTGGSDDNDFFGPCEVGYYQPDADVSFNWQASTGTTGFNLMDESPPVDTDYAFAEVTDTTTSEFSLPDLPPEVTSVRGMMLMGRFSKSDGGDCDTQMGVKSNGDAAVGIEHPVATDFTYYTDIVENNPDTGAHFTPIEFNSATITVDRTL